MKSKCVKNNSFVIEGRELEFVYDYPDQKIIIKMVVSHKTDGHQHDNYIAHDIFVTVDKLETNEMLAACLRTRLSSLLVKEPYGEGEWEIAKSKARDILKWTKAWVENELGYSVTL